MRGAGPGPVPVPVPPRPPPPGPPGPSRPRASPARPGYPVPSRRVPRSCCRPATPGPRFPPRVLAVVCDSPEDGRAGRVRSHRGVLPGSQSRGSAAGRAGQDSRCLQSVPCPRAAVGIVPGVPGGRRAAGGTLRSPFPGAAPGAVSPVGSGFPLPRDCGARPARTVRAVCAVHGPVPLFRAGHGSGCPGCVRLPAVCSEGGTAKAGRESPRAGPLL